MLQIVDAQPFSFGQRVIIRHGAADGIAAQNEVAALAALLKLFAGNARNQVDLIAEIFEKNTVSFKIGIKGDEPNVDVLQLAIDLLPIFQQERRGIEHRRADMDDLLFTARRILHALLHAARLPNQRLRVVIERMPGVRQAEPLMRSLKELHAEFLFQQIDLLHHCGG